LAAWLAGWLAGGKDGGSLARAYHVHADNALVNKPVNARDAFGRLHEWRMDPRSGRVVSERRLFDMPVDFVQIDTSRVGLKTRFVYGTRFITNRAKLPNPKYVDSLFCIDAVCKFDLQTGQSVEMPLLSAEGKPAFGGEAVFAPNPSRKPEEEDNGVLVVYAHCEETQVTECQIVDAQTMQVLCRIAMPERVPYGFHSLWVDEQHVR
jgi:carotenoid cleavage dioxygenase-like enzyme